MKVCGLICPDAMAALQRLMEHEIVHLAELLCGGRSRCGTRRFMQLAGDLFGHRAHTHALSGPRPTAAKPTENIRCGDAVEFAFRGRSFRGRVNRITTRATVLVESPRGRRYSDGKTYQKFYVPLPLLMLEAVRE